MLAYFTLGPITGKKRRPAPSQLTVKIQPNTLKPQANDLPTD